MSLLKFIPIKILCKKNSVSIEISYSTKGKLKTLRLRNRNSGALMAAFKIKSNKGDRYLWVISLVKLGRVSW